VVGELIPWKGLSRRISLFFSALQQREDVIRIEFILKNLRTLKFHPWYFLAGTLLDGKRNDLIFLRREGEVLN